MSISSSLKKKYNCLEEKPFFTGCFFTFGAKENSNSFPGLVQFLWLSSASFIGYCGRLCRLRWLGHSLYAERICTLVGDRNRLKQKMRAVSLASRFELYLECKSRPGGWLCDRLGGIDSADSFLGMGQLCCWL